MRIFRDLSVRWKLIWLILLASGLALLCVVGGVLFYEVTTFRPRAEEQLTTSTGLLQTVLRTTLDFGDPDSAERYLRRYGEETQPGILLAVVYDADGAVLASYQPAGFTGVIPQTVEAAGTAFHGGELQLWAAIKQSDGRFGHLFLRQSLPPLAARLPQYGIMVMAVVVALTVVAIALLRGVGRNFLRPLSALVRTTGAVVRQNDYSIRAEVSQADELGRLAEGVNQMLEVIGQRDAALRQAGARIQNVFDAATAVGIISTDTNGLVTLFNTGAERMLGYTSAELVAQATPARWHKADEIATRAAELSRQLGRTITGFETFVALVRQGQPDAREWTFVRKDATELRVHLVVTAVHDIQGTITGFLGVASDITQRQRAEQIIHRLSQLGRQLGAVTDADAVAKAVAEAADELLGWDACFLKLRSRDLKRAEYLLNADIVAGKRQAVERSLGDEITPIERRVMEQGPQLVLRMHPEAETGFFPFGDNDRPSNSLLYVPLRYQGRYLGLFSIQSYRPKAYTPENLDLLQTLADHVAGALERIRAEAEVAESHRLYEELVSSVPLGVYRLAVTSEQAFAFEYVSDRFCEVIGVPRVAVQADPLNAFATIHPEEREAFDQLNARAIRERTPFSWEGRAVINGQTRWLHIGSRPTMLPERLPFWTGVVLDITERKQAEERVRQSQTGLEEAQALAEIGSWELDMATNRGDWSREMFRLHGRDYELGNPNFEEFLALVHPEDRERLLRHYQSQLRGEASEEIVYRTAPGRGGVRHLRIQLAQFKDAAGRNTRVRGTCTDITKQLQADQERQHLEAQLRQAQKMEAIGQLSGGVAHDFNNLLSIIQGNLSLARMGPELPAEVRECLQEIDQATVRAANLTRQLLTFSRRQTMQLKTLDLNDVVAQMTRMLTRILGEDIKLHSHYARQQLTVHVDAGMMEQVLLNFVVNARDAMPKGGRLIIETSREEVTTAEAEQMAEARPGRFARLSVSDTGCGINPEVLPKIFEPFFTTKDVGKGTGLGLATVYGIAKQHKGWVSAYSEVGIGTTFRVYIPLCESPDPSDTAKLPAMPAEAPPTATRETILLVEDELALRKLGSKILRRLGYVVLEAPTGVEALEVWRQNRRQIRLLLTDIVMPDGLSGMELARRLQQDEPRLPVIYTSGYSAEIAGREFPLQEGVNFLAKPFNPAALAEVVRTSLANWPA